jgi:hypothetical protein
MEYRYCPNMILIDTPGLIQAPRGKHLNAQQQALFQAAKESEALVLHKMRCQDYIILCVEDTTDWKHATTRNVVMQVRVRCVRECVCVFLCARVRCVCVCVAAHRSRALHCQCSDKAV